MQITTQPGDKRQYVGPEHTIDDVRKKQKDGTLSSSAFHQMTDVIKDMVKGESFTDAMSKQSVMLAEIFGGDLKQVETVSIGKESDKYTVINTITNEPVVKNAEWTKEEAEKQAAKYTRLNKKEWQGMQQRFEVRSLGAKTQQSLAITPQMKRALLGEGQPMFGKMPDKIQEAINHARIIKTMT